jgi:uncharacterized membrane-anchored protein
MRLSLALPLLFAAAPLLVQTAPSKAEGPQPEMSAEEMRAAYQEHVSKTLGSIKYQEGTAELPGGMARLELPTGYRFLKAGDAKKVVVDLWGNPPENASDLLGMVVPAGEDLAKPDSWAIVVTFAEDGHVSDSDADEIDYDELLSQLKEGNRRDNETRATQGYETMLLTGWAVPPRYDKEQKVLYWAKQYADPGGSEGTLNYDMRVLGRRGVLSLNGVAGVGRVADIESVTPAIVSMIHYNEGHRYADFDSATDKKADYSLAGLVLGGAVAAKLAAKAGILAKLGAILVAGKKFVIFIVLGIGIFLKKIFGRKSAA